MTNRRTVAILALAMVGGACGGGSGGGRTSPSSPGASPSPSTSPSPVGSGTPSSEQAAALDTVRVKLRPIVELVSPLAMAVRSGDDALYVAEQGGRVMAVRGGAVDPEPVLDVRGRISTGGERGLLGLAFAEDGSLLYVDYTDTGGDTNVVEYRMRDDGTADAGSARRVLFVQQPFSNHNGGNLAFGPDGDLYIGLGDGGSAGDPSGNGQNLGTLLGKMLRIDPRRSGDAPYRIPPDNPFAGRKGARPEIWAYGLRNPWRYSFDRATGDLWIGDVGQNAWEEVDFQPASSNGGENYGWNTMEGRHEYVGPPAANAEVPVAEYPHGGGVCAVTGGYVYRGSAIPDLGGAYVYADFCLGHVMALRLDGGKVIDQAGLGVSAESISSFGQDQDGELYVISLGGEILRIVPG